MFLSAKLRSVVKSSKLGKFEIENHPRMDPGFVELKKIQEKCAKSDKYLWNMRSSRTTALTYLLCFTTIVAAFNAAEFTYNQVLYRK